MGRAALLVIGEVFVNSCSLDGTTQTDPSSVVIVQMLLSNHFLTGHDVAQVLVHYENLVGMAFW